MTVQQSDGRALTPRVAVPDRVGQATVVEQSRAVAQVEAQVIIAKRFPRDVPAAIDAMKEACRSERLAEKAFYRFPRGGAPVSGSSIHLARELARIWGNLEYGVHEMRRDDIARQSEMLAFAWDLQTNTRHSLVFINPHMRDRTDGPVALTDMRDIYESNSNAGARRVREAIFAMVPAWFKEEAEELCRRTLREGGGVPLAKRVADAIAEFAKQGITQRQLEVNRGRDATRWIEEDVAQLRVIYRSLAHGEISKDEEFPPERVTPDEILSQPKTGAQAPSVPGPAESGASPADGGSTTAGAGEPGGPGTPRDEDGVGEPDGPVNQGPRPVSAAELGRTLAALPFQAQEIKDFLSWRAGRPVNGIKDLEEADRWAIASYIAEAKDVAEGDPSEAVSAIWTEYRIDKGIAEPGSQA